MTAENGNGSKYITWPQGLLLSIGIGAICVTMHVHAASVYATKDELRQHADSKLEGLVESLQKLVDRIEQ